jgi:catechol 2,3-dioxygenase-like lactoylglutathione lyase family enzyme
MIDHVAVKTSKALFEQTIRFYERALIPLGYKQIREIPSVAVGYGETMPDFWVFASDGHDHTAHVALRAKGSYIS